MTKANVIPGMAGDQGASSPCEDRAVVNGAASVSALRASIPSAAKVPFSGERYKGLGLITRKRSGAELKWTARLRAELVLKQNGRCAFCKRRLSAACIGGGPSHSATVEHLVPRAEGGALSYDNCVAACQFCNRYRHWKHTQRPYLRSRLINLLHWVSGHTEALAQAIEARQRQDAKAGLARKGESAVAGSDVPEPHRDTPIHSTKHGEGR